MRTRVRNVLISSDYSSQEVKVLAQVCEDEEMIRLFKEGKDFYSDVASKALGFPYEQCLEFFPKGTYIKKKGDVYYWADENDYTHIADGSHTHKEGKNRRTQAKSILLG